MDWRTDWLALHDRIEGVEQSLDLYLHSLKVSSEDPYGVRKKVFRPAFHSIVGALRNFRSSHSKSLPTNAANAIDRFLSDNANMIESAQLDNFGHMVACVTALSGFRSELRFQLTDRSAALLRLTERAIAHLQRTLVADLFAQERWRAAYDAGEVACERLGAVHLLLHGIWAFKTSAAGERTDLVYGEPVSEDSLSAAEGLVLTEWKLVRKPSELQDKLSAGEAQAALYAAGILGGVELADSRFVIAVSLDRLSMPADEIRSGVIYRRRNIAITPSTPSVSAMKFQGSVT
ncbi:MAG: hypothetical protein WEA80_13130 [Gemmatimonadaceae bacterium]